MPTIWTAGYDVPGYSSDGTVLAFENRAQALIFIVEALRGVACQRSMSADSPDDSLAAGYEQAADSLEDQDAGATGDWSETFEDGRVTFWLISSEMAAD